MKREPRTGTNQSITAISCAAVSSIQEHKRRTAYLVSGFAGAQMISPVLGHVLKEVQREIKDAQSSSSSSGTKPLSSNFLIQVIDHVASVQGLDLSTQERDELLSWLERDGRPFGILQELIDDPQVSDVIVKDYAHISVQIGRKNFHTGLSFGSQEHYELFVEQLLHQAGSSCSNKKPVTDGMVGNFARIHVVHSSLCASGPYLTIRLNRYGTVTNQDLVQAGLAPRAVFEYLQAVMRGGCSLLIAGEVGTGKTTLLRALAAQIPAEDSILVIEDTPEIRLEHPHVRYITTREENCEGEGRISPAICIRGGMRMAMNRIVFGEMRDAEAAEAFIDVCSSGHPGISTIHARSSTEALTRLELFLGRAQRGVTRHVTSEQISSAVQIVVYVNVCRLTGARRIFEVKEIGPVADGVLRQREIFRYEPRSERVVWKLCQRLSAHKEILEQGESPVILHTMPGQLDLEEPSTVFVPSFS